jgi:mannitol operon transcriptional antiterminator
MGTSRLLAAQIEKNFPHIHIVDTVSLLHLEAAIRKKAPIDLIISTVPFEHDRHRVVVVNSFLEKEDFELIETHLYGLPLISGTAHEENIEIEDTVMTVNRYGEGIVQLTNHMFFSDRIEAASKAEVIAEAASFVQSEVTGVDGQQLERDLLQREELGGIVLEESGLAMLHCRSEAVPVMMVCVLRAKKPVPWNNNGQDSFVETVLLLLAPRSAPKEHIEMISEISAMLIEEDFVDALTNKPFTLVHKELKSIIGKGYLNKTSSFFWGKR